MTSLFSMYWNLILYEISGRVSNRKIYKINLTLTYSERVATSSNPQSINFKGAWNLRLPTFSRESGVTELKKCAFKSAELAHRSWEKTLLNYQHKNETSSGDVDPVVIVDFHQRNFIAQIDISLGKLNEFLICYSRDRETNEKVASHDKNFPSGKLTFRAPRVSAAWIMLPNLSLLMRIIERSDMKVSR